MGKPEIKEAFVTESMKLPKNIAYTGDIDTINAYLNGDPMDALGRPLGERARRHLTDRIANIEYINETAKQFQSRKFIPLSAKQTENGCILEGIHQPERQQTGHCCWTMPAKLMLQSRGIDLDQECIRCYKPEITLSAEQLNDLDDGVVKEFTRDVNGNVKNLSGLMHKFVPNSAMVQVSYFVPFMVKSDPEAQRENELFRENFRQKVSTALKDYRSPVALLKNGHYRTIVGIDGDDLIVKDSLSAIHGPDSNYRVSIDSLFSKPGDSTEITFMRDLTVTDAEKLPEELGKFKDALNVGAGEEKGLLTVTAGGKNGIKNHDGSSIELCGGLQHGNKPNLLYSQPIGSRADNSQIEVTEEWILPEKLNENVITLERTEDVAKNEERELTDDAAASVFGRDSGIKDAALLKRYAELSDVSAREDEYFNELPQGSYKRLTEMVNEARQEMRQLSAVNRLQWTTDDMKNNQRCMRIMVLGKLIEAERAMGDGLPGALERRFDNGRGLEDMLDDVQLRHIFDKCPAPSEMEQEDIASFILEDEAGRIVKQTLNEAADKNPQLSAKQRAQQKAKIADGTDPLHEMNRLGMLYKKLKNADPALMKSSDSFKAMKRSLETVITLRQKRGDVYDRDADAVTRAEESEALTAAYDELNRNARAYMRTKAPSTFKSGSIAEKRYAAANDILDLSAQFAHSYEKNAANIRSREISVAESRSSVISTDSLSF